MAGESYSVRLVSSTGEESEGTFLVDIDHGGEKCRLLLRSPHGEHVGVASDFFEAMCLVRRKLEKLGSYPVCYGSSLNVFPSGMGRDMGQGLMAYRLQIGKQARMVDLVGIFETGPDVHPASVEEQSAFYDRWLRSLQPS